MDVKDWQIHERAREGELAEEREREYIAERFQDLGVEAPEGLAGFSADAAWKALGEVKTKQKETRGEVGAKRKAEWAERVRLEAAYDAYLKTESDPYKDKWITTPISQAGPEGEVTIIDKAEWIEDKMREWREFFAEDAEAAPAERKGRGFTDLWE